MPSTSVLIVGYHAYDELDRCLASLTHHEPHAEVIVVDQDADSGRGRPLADRHPGVIYVARRENPGFGAGINAAAAHATAPLLLILNPDVELRSPVTRRLAACLEAHPDVGIVGGLIREVDGAVQHSARRFPDLSTAFGGRTSWLTRISPRNPLTRRNLATIDSPGRAVNVDWVSGAFLMVRTDVFVRWGASMSDSSCTGRTPTSASAHIMQGGRPCSSLERRSCT